MFVLAVISVCPVQASNATKFSMSDLGFTGPQTILVYESGNLTGVYNTSSDMIPVPEHDFQVIIKPETKNRDLGAMLTDLMAWLTEYWYVIVFFIRGIILLTRKW